MPYVNANGPMSAQDLGFPDVCNTPAGPAVVPTPYPNINLNTTSIPSQSRCLLMCMPAHNMKTVRAISTGDNAGVALGVMSGTVMGPGRAMKGSTNLFIGGPPATKMAMPTKQNGSSPNTFGLSISPSQTRLMALR
ncbi:DUF4150 domain-containing protein [Bradyrhizobium sp. CCGUVB23]|uniref:DUF4150 domain-containing protein n=1 Tax=Bradyrhizobium sp. CCGUVB23 TaxID=2949630 RepID=UPI0020B29809|nr:DUF4150 domain-containing protein [Bradyrhizobium sp. CCGUVB23]MCP3460862.1 DUF4150 domain-containing protein [Bradyrhizobium sp. CCGUVB23]